MIQLQQEQLLERLLEQQHLQAIHPVAVVLAMQQVYTLGGVRVMVARLVNVMLATIKMVIHVWFAQAGQR